MKTLCILVVTAAVCVLAVAGETDQKSIVPRDAVLNGAFETNRGGKPVAWELAEGWSVSRGPGRNGGGGLEFVCSKPLSERTSCVQISDRVQAGKVYDFEAWVSSELEDGAGAAVGIEFLDEQDKVVSSAYSGSAPNRAGWKRLMVRTKRLPKTVRKVRLTPQVPAKGCGRVAFDDISLTAVEVLPVTAFVTTAYRDELADEDGFIRLCGGADLADAGVAAKDVEAWFSWKASTGAEKRMRADSFDGTDAFLRLSAADIPKGELTLAFELRTTGGRVLGLRERPLVRLAKHVPRAVRLDPHGRVILHGKPFFPIAIYDHTAISNRIALLKDSPFNAIMPYHGIDRAMLDWCQANGIVASLHMGDIGSMPEVTNRVAALEAEKRGKRARELRALKDHPALFALLDNDERPIPLLPKVETRYRMLREVDPDHPAWAVLYQVDQIRAYCDSTDAIGSDPYPLPHSSLARVSVSTRKCRNGTFGALSLWQTSQAFDWAAYKTKGTPDCDVSKYRAPTLAEMKNMNWQMIANGANALLVYSYSPLVKMSWRDPLERRWDEVKESVREIAEQSDVFLSVEETPTVGPVPESLAVRTWKKGASVFVAVVNASGSSLKTSFGLGSVTGTAKTVCGTGVVAKDGVLSVDFAPEGYAFVEFVR